MVGNLINNTVLTPGQTGQAGAFVLLVLLVSLRADARTTCARSPASDGALRDETRDRARWWRDPWRKPRLLAAVTIGYLLWSLLPVLIAVLFSFNDGRSRTSWQGFSMRWYYGDPLRSVWHDDTLQTALIQTLKLGRAGHAGPVPLGVALALGLRPLARPDPGRRQLDAAAVVRAARDPARGRAAVRRHQRWSCRSPSAPPRR